MAVSAILKTIMKHKQQLKLVVPVHYDDIDSNVAAQNKKLGYYRKPTNSLIPQQSLEVINALGIPQNIPQYSLGYTGTGYGMTFNNGYGRPYGPEYMNYQPYSNVPLERSDKKLEDVSL